MGRLRAGREQGSLRPGLYAGGEEPHSPQTGQKLTRAQKGEGRWTGLGRALPGLRRRDPGTVHLLGANRVQLQTAGCPEACSTKASGSRQVALIGVHNETVGTEAGGSGLDSGKDFPGDAEKGRVSVPGSRTHWVYRVVKRWTDAWGPQ